MRPVSRSDITVPNLLTLLRIVMALGAGYFLMITGKRTTMAASLLLLSSLLDFFDGWYARRFSQTTRLGAHLDPFADKVMISVMFLVLALDFRWKWFTFFTSVILARELSITVYRMIVHKRSGSMVPASLLGKAKTVVQCLVGGGLIFYIYIYPGRTPGHSLPIFIAMALTVFITVDSGLRYVLPICADGKKRSVIERLWQSVFGLGAREV